MGTRGLTCVVADGDYRIAQYGQWDHCPSGQGKDVLAFLRSMDERMFRAQLARCAWLTPEQAKGMTLRDPEAWLLTRDHGAAVLGLIQNAPGDGPLLLQDHRAFAADSLLCEYAYVIDLDRRTFEVYEGFNEEPVSDGERFAGVIGDDVAEGYYPVRLLASFSVDDLPTDEAFMAACEKPDA